MSKLFFLIGFMGSGKSTMGHAVADEMGITFLDLDEWIEKREGKSIKNIFEEKGEAYFRQLESSLLKALTFLPEAKYLVATGGGTPCFEDNMKWMNAHGTTIYLKPTIQVLGERLIADRDKRPLLKGTKPTDIQQFIHTLLQQREAFYLQARHTLTAEDLAPNKLIQLIKMQIGG